MSFRVTDCIITTNSITIKFSDKVHQGFNDQNGADNLNNYSVFSPNSVDFNKSPSATILDVFHELKDAGTDFAAPTPTITNDTVTININSSDKTNEFEPGDFVHVVVRNVQSTGQEDLRDKLAITGNVVRGRVSRATRDMEDAISYPILTEDISQRQSPVSTPSSGGAVGGSSGGLGLVAAKAVSDVLGWKPNVADPKGFVGALTQSFNLTDIEGHVESTWVPRTYAVQTDLGGGITGAQASLYTRAKNALDSALPLLDGLYPLNPEADPEYVKALREMARSQMGEIVKELGTVGLPSILRIDTYFEILVGQSPAKISTATIQFDPDRIKGTLGQLRDTYGISFAGNSFNNSVEDEQDITNFRVISDYMTSLMQSWISNRDFFRLGTKAPAFFGTQLVLISRQFNVITETVNEVRFTLDSVFIGPNERQTLLLEFDDVTLAPMFMEDVLVEVEKFAADEGPRLLRDSGKISVTNNILPVVRSLKKLINGAHHPANIDDLPDGFKTARVRNSLDDLRDQIVALADLVEQVEQKVPLAEGKLTISGIQVVHSGHAPRVNDPLSGHNPTDARLSIYGTGFELGAEVGIHSSVLLSLNFIKKEFYSAERIDVTFDPSHWGTPGKHDIIVTNPDGQSANLCNAFTIIKDSDHFFSVDTPLLATGSEAGAAVRPLIRKRSVGITTSGLVQTTPHASDSDVETLKGSVAQLHKSNKEISKQLVAVMEKLSALEHPAKEKKSK